MSTNYFFSCSFCSQNSKRTRQAEDGRNDHELKKLENNTWHFYFCYSLYLPANYLPESCR